MKNKKELRRQILRTIRELKPVQINKGGWFRIKRDQDQEIILMYISEKIHSSSFLKQKFILEYFENCDDDSFEKTNHFCDIEGEPITVILNTGSPNECPPGVNCG